MVRGQELPLLRSPIWLHFYCVAVSVRARRVAAVGKSGTPIIHFECPGKELSGHEEIAVAIAGVCHAAAVLVPMAEETMIVDAEVF